MHFVPSHFGNDQIIRIGMPIGFKKQTSLEEGFGRGNTRKTRLEWMYLTNISLKAGHWEKAI